MVHQGRGDVVARNAVVHGMVQKAWAPIIFVVMALAHFSLPTQLLLHVRHWHTCAGSASRPVHQKNEYWPWMAA